MFRHQRDRFGARRWRFFHLLLAIQLVPRIEKQLVIPIANQRIELLRRQSAIQIDFFKRGSLFAKETLRFSAGRSSRFKIQLGHT